MVAWCVVLRGGPLCIPPPPPFPPPHTWHPSHTHKTLHTTTHTSHTCPFHTQNPTHHHTRTCPLPTYITAPAANGTVVVAAAAPHKAERKSVEHAHHEGKAPGSRASHEDPVIHNNMMDK